MQVSTTQIISIIISFTEFAHDVFRGTVFRVELFPISNEVAYSRDFALPLSIFLPLLVRQFDKQNIESARRRKKNDEILARLPV